MNAIRRSYWYFRLWHALHRALLSVRPEPGLVAHTNPNIDQMRFRGRNDDGSETTATWKAAENVNWTQAVDVNFRIRLTAQETAGAGGAIAPKLQYNLNGAGWNDVNASSLVARSSDSTNLTDGAATTHQDGGTGTFVAGFVDDVSGTNSPATISIAAAGHTEVEFCLQLRSADVANNDTVQFRIINDAGSLLNAYSSIPSVTVSETSADNRAEISWVEFEVPSPNNRAEVSWVEVEVPTPDNRAEVSWVEVEVPTPDNRADVSWVEVEVPSLDNRAEVSWTELEVPTPDNRSEVSWAELEVPTPDNRADVSWAEFEVPAVGGAPDNRAELSWAEFEVPNIPDNRAEVSWTELEVPSPDNRSEVSWAEFEVPTPDNRGEVSWAELEVPTPDNRADVSWVEVEVPNIPDNRAEVSWTELEVPSLNNRAEVSWAELEVPTFGEESILMVLVQYLRRRGHKIE